MSLVKLGLSDTTSRPAAVFITSYSDTSGVADAPNFGGAMMTHDGSATIILSPMVMLADTGPSDVSSYQPSLFAKSLTGLFGITLPDFPRPPKTDNRPSASVLSSPKYTGMS